MDYGRLLKRTWDVAWGSKWLFTVGLAIVIGSWGLGSIVGVAYDPHTVFSQIYADPPPGLSLAELRAIEPVFVTFYYAFMMVCIPVGLALFAVAQVGVGALIAGASQAEAEPTLHFADALQIGWNRGGRLLGVAVLLSLPGMLIGLLNTLLSNQMGAYNPYDTAAAAAMMGQSLLSLSLSCLSFLIGIPLAIWLFLSEQAVVQEDKKLFESMGRAWRVFLAQPGQVIVLILIQYGITIALALILVVPATIAIFVMVLVPILVPLLCVLGLAFIVLGVFISTLSYVLWTLAYAHWLEQEEPALPPAGAEADASDA